MDLIKLFMDTFDKQIMLSKYSKNNSNSNSKSHYTHQYIPQYTHQYTPHYSSSSVTSSQYVYQNYSSLQYVPIIQITKVDIAQYIKNTLYEIIFIESIDISSANKYSLYEKLFNIKIEKVKNQYLLLINADYKINNLKNKFINLKNKKILSILNGAIFCLGDTINFNNRSHLRLLTILSPRFEEIPHNNLHNLHNLHNSHYVNIENKKIIPSVNGTLISVYWFNDKWNVSSRNVIFANLMNEFISATKAQSADLFDFNYLDKSIFYNFVLMNIPQLFGDKILVINYENLLNKKPLFMTKIVLIDYYNVVPTNIKNILSSLNIHDIREYAINIDYPRIHKLLANYVVKNIDKIISTDIINYIFGFYDYENMRFYETGFNKILKKMLHWNGPKIYNYNYNTDTSYTDNYNSNYTNYIILRANINYIWSSYFLHMFPQYTQKYNEFSQIKQKIIANIISQIKKNKKNKHNDYELSAEIYTELSAEISTNNSVSAISTIKINKLTEYFYEKILKENSFNIDPYSIDSAKILLDWVSDPEHLLVYSNILLS
jgi:hypothetical protein